MNTHDRREALLGWLRARNSGTAAQAAGHFQVTERTVLRDIRALRERGEPISSSPGVGGGFHLARTARLQAVRLTVEEVVGLALAASVARQTAAGLPYSMAAEHAVDRLIRTLPSERAERVRDFMGRITIGLPASAGMSAGLGVIEQELAGKFERAFSERRVLSFGYMDRHGQATARVVEPHGLLLRMPIWYVIAHDRMREAARMFRVDRMRDVEVSGEVFEPKPASWFEEYLDPRYANPEHRPPSPQTS